MSENKLPTHNEILLVLGSYVTSFSGLLYSLETSTEHIITFDSNANYLLIRALISDQTASPISSKFFTVFAEKWKTVLSDDDKRFLKALRKSINTAIEKRNRYMHDAWLMSSTSGVLKKEEFALSRTRSNATGVELSSQSITTDILKTESEELKELSTIVNKLVFYHNDDLVGPNISSRFGLNEDKKPIILES